MIRAVSKLLDVSPYKLVLLFNTGESKVVDLEEKIRAHSKSADSKYRDLLDPDYFQTVQFEPEWETIHWANGIDFCPDVLYAMGIEVPSDSTLSRHS